MTATAVEVTAEPELIARFGATTVPYFIVNGVHGFAGPVPELMLLQRVSDLARSGAEEER